MSQSKTLGTQSRKSYVGILLLTVCAFLTQTVLTAPTDAAYGDNDVPKDNEFSNMVKRPAFFVGSRYGRSSANSAAGGGSASNPAVGTSKTRRLIIVPRNDRFFLGSRYGKRSDEYLSPYEQSSLSLGLSKASLRDAERSVESGLDAEKPSSSSRTRVHTMSCVYTGIRDFYRCSNVNADELNNIMNRNDGMSLDSNSIASEDVNTK